MQIDRELYHVVCRNALALVLRMRQSRIRKIKRMIKLLGCHRWIRRIYNSIFAVNSLQQTLRMHLIRLFLYMTKVVCLCLFVAQTLFMTVQHNVVRRYSTWNITLLTKIYSLRNIAYILHTLAFRELSAKFEYRFLAHTIYYHVGSRIAKYTLLQSVLPIVVMGKSTQRSLNASKYNGNIREQLLQNLSINNGGILRTTVVTSIRTISIF